MTAALPYAVAVVANPDAIPEARRLFHERACACAGALDVCAEAAQPSRMRGAA